MKDNHWNYPDPIGFIIENGTAITCISLVNRL